MMVSSLFFDFNAAAGRVSCGLNVDGLETIITGSTLRNVKQSASPGVGVDAPQTYAQIHLEAPRQRG
jgi:hypothetical protein